MERIEPACGNGATPQPLKLGWGWALTAPVWLFPGYFLLAWLVHGTRFATITGYLTVLLLAACSYTDIRWGKIRNWATYTALLWALAVNTFATLFCSPASEGDPEPQSRFLAWLNVADLQDVLGTVGLAESMVGAILAFVVLLLLYQLAGGGAGDVKLAVALGALLGPALVVAALMSAYIIAGVIVVSWVLVTKGPLAFFCPLFRRMGSLFAPKWVKAPSPEETRLLHGKVRLAPFYAAGTLVVLTGLDSQVVSAVLGGLNLGN